MAWTDILGCYDPELNPLADLVGDFDAGSSTGTDAWRIVQWRQIASALGWSAGFEAVVRKSWRPGNRASASGLVGTVPVSYPTLGQEATEAFTQWLARRQAPTPVEDFDRARVRHLSIQAAESLGAEAHALFLVTLPSTQLPDSGCYEIGAPPTNSTPIPGPQRRVAATSIVGRAQVAVTQVATVSRNALDQILGIAPPPGRRTARAFRAARGASYFHSRHPMNVAACTYPIRLSFGTFPWIYGNMLGREAPGLTWESGRPWRPAGLAMAIMASLWADPVVNLRQDARLVAEQYGIFRDQTNAVLEGVPIWTEETRGAIGRLYRRGGFLYVHQGSTELAYRTGPRGAVSASAYNYVKACFARFFCARRSFARSINNLPAAAHAAFASNPDPCAQQQIGRLAV